MLYMEVLCHLCKTPFNKEPCKVKKHKNSFCSRLCHYTFKTKAIQKICSICGNDFVITPKELAKRQTASCSVACSKKAVSKLFSMTRKCKICGEEFTFPKSRAKYFKKEYCSLYCSNSREASGYTHENKYREIALRTLPNECYFCSDKTNKLEVHHKDHNRKNNAIQNLCILCISCHRKIHVLHPTLAT